VTLNLKGVQLESLGYIGFRHAVDLTDAKAFKSYIQKYNKYQKMNMADLKKLKENAVKGENFDQVENFIEYEQFTKNAYYPAVIKFTHSLFDLQENGPEWLQSFFENMLSGLKEERAKYSCDRDYKRART